MKNIIFSTLLFTSIAFADDLIQFDANLGVTVCTLTSTREIVKCYPSQTQIRETLTATLVHTDCGPNCKYNDTAEVSKSYTLTRPDTQEEMRVKLNVVVTRASGLFDPSVTDYFVEVTLAPKGGTHDDLRSSIVDVKDLSAVNDVAVEGKATVQSLPDGNILESRPRVGVTKLKILPK